MITGRNDIEMSQLLCDIKIISMKYSPNFDRFNENRIETKISINILHQNSICQLI